MQLGVIYARYSCEKQTENSILGQIRECKDFAKKNDIEIVDIYKDEAISGRTATKRPAFMQMIKDSNTRKFNCVIVWKGDRFSRSRADAAKYKGLLKSYGVKVLSATEANLTGPEAILMDGINEAFAEYFSVELAAKVERGMTQNAIDGKFNGGTMPIGYDLDKDRKIVIDEKEAYIVKKIFDLYAHTDSTIVEIVDKLNNEGFRSKRGKKLTRSTVHRMLSNERYIGIYRFKETVNNNFFPRLIDDVIWNQVQTKCRLLRHRAGKANAKEQRYYLCGKLICGECGEFYSGHSTSYSGKRYIHYICNGRRYKKGCKEPLIDKDMIEIAVTKLAIEHLTNTVLREKLIEGIYKTQITSDGEVEALEKNYNDVNKNIINLRKAIEDGCDFSLFKDRIIELNQQLDQITERIEVLKAEKAIFDVEHINHFLDYAKEFMSIDTSSREAIISSFIEKVYVWHDGRVIIVYKYKELNELSLSDKLTICDLNNMAHQLSKNNRFN